MVNREHKLLNGEETEVVLKGKSVTEVVLKGSVTEVVLKGKSMAEVVLKGKRKAFAKAGQVANWGWRRHLQRRSCERELEKAFAKAGQVANWGWRSCERELETEVVDVKRSGRERDDTTK